MKIIDVKMPAWFRMVEFMPGGLPETADYRYATPDADCFVLARIIPAEDAIPYGDPRAVIDSIHRDLGDDQGLVAVKDGRTDSGRRFLYTVVKTLQNPGGVQYCLTAHIEYPDGTAQVQGFFDETGTTGVRDALVFSLLESRGLVRVTEQGIENWNADPCDPEYRRGSLMNRSEREEYDAIFPEHPLTELRRFVFELIRLN